MCLKMDTPLTSLFCWVCCHLHLLFRASRSAPLFIMVYRDFLSIRSLSWKPHIPDEHKHNSFRLEDCGTYLTQARDII